jgi:DNA-binding NarL/FixJ family response regulator
VKVYAHVPQATDAWHSGPDAGSQPSAHREHDGWEKTPNGAHHSEVAWEQDFRETLRILIIDDCTLHRDNLAAVFALNGMATPSAVWDLPSLIVALDGIDPDIVLLNIATRNCAPLLRAAMGMIPGVRVIVLGASEDDESEIVACAEAGVAGYHMRTDSLEDLFVLIRKVAAGETSCSPRVSAILLRRLSALASQRQPAAKERALTTREAQILKMLELGRSNQDIATQLSIAVHTVKNHVHSLLSKLGVSTRAEAATLSRTIRLHQR